MLFAFVFPPFFKVLGAQGKAIQLSIDLLPGEVLGSIFAGYVPLASQNPYPIIVYFVAIYSCCL